MSEFLKYLRTKGPELLIGGVATLAGAIGLYGLIKGTIGEFKKNKKEKEGFGLRRVIGLEEGLENNFSSLDGKPIAFAEFKGDIRVPLYGVRVGDKLHYVPGSTTIDDANNERPSKFKLASLDDNSLAA
jgi:hypothetical protein